jgi:probable phosphoglycerate mutase
MAVSYFLTKKPSEILLGWKIIISGIQCDISMKQVYNSKCGKNQSKAMRILMQDLRVRWRKERIMGCVYFVRHGQTVWNVENKICGATDIALTDLGHQQAVDTGKKILEAGIRADEILYSPLIRAADTARHISEITGIPARMEPRLKEQNFGKWESTARDGQEFQKAKGDFCSRYEGGESMLQLAQRIYNLMDEIKAESNTKTYILVAHNGISRVIQSYFYDMTNAEYASFGIKNCEILKYEFS